MQITPVALTSYSREFGQVIHHGVTCMNVVINERYPSLGSLSSKNRHTGERHSTRPEYLLGPVRMKLGFFLLKRDKLGINRDQGARAWQFVLLQRFMFDHRRITISSTRREDVSNGNQHQVDSSYLEIVMSSERIAVSPDSGSGSKLSNSGESTRSQNSTAGI